MKLFFLRILASCERTISRWFRISRNGEGTTDGGAYIGKWTFFSDFGRRIAIVGTNGRVHTLTGYYAVHHYYQKGKLVKRRPVRKNLQPGERLASAQEIFDFQCDLARRFTTAHCRMMS